MKTANLMPVVAALVSASTVLAADAPVRLRVANPIDAAREGETIEVRAGALASSFQPADLPRLSVIDARTAREVLAQAVDEDGDGAYDLLVFQADFAAGETRDFTLVRGERRKPGRQDFRVYGRFVRERQDDFAWENDKVAFRVYGPALETFTKEPLTSSAIDAWSKRTQRLVLNDWYLVDDYHQDHGEGGDFYPAGKSRGCGGSGLWTTEGLVVAGNFRESRLLASGPIRLVFELTYPVWAKAPSVKETKRVTLDAGSHFNRFESRYQVAGSAPVAWASGIRKAKAATTRIDRERGFLRTWEYQGNYGDGGWLGCGVVMDPSQVSETVEADGNLLVVSHTPAGQPAIWYAGSAWDRGGDFKDAEAWDRHLEAFARRLASPLHVEVVAP